MQLGALAGEESGGDRDRPPIVLLHGLTFDRRTWRPGIDAFRSVDLHVLDEPHPQRGQHELPTRPLD